MSTINQTERTSTSAYPSGHVGHLSSSQEEAVEQFKNICREDGCYSSSNDTPSHDDQTLLRFLRARNFVPKDAFQQFKATEKWRKEQDIDNWYNTIDIDEYEETRLLYTQWTGRRDKRGIPLYVFKIGGVDSKKLSDYDSAIGTTKEPGALSPKLRRLFATYEHLTSFVMPLCSSVPSRPYPETPISQTCNIVDISGVGIRQFWSLKAHLQDASVLATAHYPETLGRTFIVGAPSFFPTIWSWLKGWFDPGTVSKIFILSQSEIEKVLQDHIEKCDITREYGGTLDWQFGQLPNLDPEILGMMSLKDGETGLPKGPIRWTQSADGATVEARALGSKDGKQRDEVVAEIPSSVFTESFNVGDGRRVGGYSG